MLWANSREVVTVNIDHALIRGHAEHVTQIIMFNSHCKHLREYSYSHSTDEYIEALKGRVSFSRSYDSNQ